MTSLARPQRHLDKISGAGCLDLFAEAAMIEVQQRVVAFVGRAADAVSDQDDAESMIDRPHNRRRHADVGFRAGHDQRVRLAGTKMLQQGRAKKAEYRVLSITVAGGLSLRKVGMRSSSRTSRRSRVVSGHAS